MSGHDHFQLHWSVIILYTVFHSYLFTQISAVHVEQATHVPNDIVLESIKFIAIAVYNISAFNFIVIKIKTSLAEVNLHAVYWHHSFLMHFQHYIPCVVLHLITRSNVSEKWSRKEMLLLIKRWNLIGLVGDDNDDGLSAAMKPHFDMIL